MPCQVPDSVKGERLDRIAQLHQEVAAAKRGNLVGQRVTVLVDNGGSNAVGRTQGQAPEIDDVVYIADGGVKVGEFLELEIVDTLGPYDLIGRKP